MRIACNQVELSKMAQIAQRYSSKVVNTETQGLLLEAEGDELVLVATNTEDGIRCRIKAMVEEPGAVVVDANYFADVVKKMPGPQILIDEKNNLIELSSQKSRFELTVMDTDNFLAFPEINNGWGIRLGREQLKDMLSSVIHSVAKNEIRYILNGILLEFTPDELRIVATDSHRLAIKKTAIQGGTSLKFIIHNKIATQIIGIMGTAEEDTVELRAGETHISFVIDDIEIIARCMDGDYPQYEAIIPQEFQASIVASSKELKDAIDRLMVIDKRPIHFDFKSDEMALTVKDDTKGLGMEYILISREGESLDISFNPVFLLDGLKSIVEEDVVIKFSGPMSAAVMRNPDDDSFLYIVMPTFT